MTPTLPVMCDSEKTRFQDLPDLLLDWYDRHARELPWRIGPSDRQNGIKADPYRVWLAEIMLQQTTVPHATRYYLEFTRRWPTVDALAAAEDADVMAAWAGLGYYARARNLLKCSRKIVELGGWPTTAAELKTLPGIGPYTSGAIGALAFGEREAAVDGNVERVFSRLMATKGDWKAEKARINKVVSALVPASRPAEFAEGLMDLGATVCTPKSPNCLICPLQSCCVAMTEGRAERYPIKPKKANIPTRSGSLYVIKGAIRGQYAVQKRSEKGLLGGMLGLPGSAWTEGGNAEPEFPYEGNWSELGEVRHVFTHFALKLKVYTIQSDRLPKGCHWADGDALMDSLPTVFKKALKLALKPVDNIK